MTSKTISPKKGTTIVSGLRMSETREESSQGVAAQKRDSDNKKKMTSPLDVHSTSKSKKATGDHLETEISKAPALLPVELLEKIAAELPEPKHQTNKIDGKRSLGDLKNFRLASKNLSQAAFYHKDVEPQIVSGMVRKFLKDPTLELTGDLVERLARVKYLDLAQANIQFKPEVEAQLSMTRLGQVLAATKNLRSLDLSGNHLNVSLPPEVYQLDALERLNLSDNPLFTLSADLGKLIALQELDLSKTELESLPEAIGKLSALKTLNLDWATQIRTLPETIGNLVGLERLGLCRTFCLQFLPETIGNLVKLRELDLTSSSLRRLPKAIGGLIALEQLHLNDSNVNSLPDTIGHLVALKQLHLVGISDLFLPDTISNLVSLTDLDLRGTFLTKDLSAAVRNLAGLNLRL